MTTQRFPVIDPTEKITLSFDFSAGLASGETLTGSPVVVVTVDYGVDASPQAIVLASAISGSLVNVIVNNTKDGVDYHVHVTTTTSNAQKTLALAGILPSRAL